MTNALDEMSAQSESRTALIVEDDDEMRALLKSLVLDLGYKQVSGVARLEPALERLESDSFSMAIIDLNLGEQDGVDLISAIRSHPHACVHTMPILVASTVATGHRIQSAILAGADSFLCKPFSIANLKRQIRFADTKALVRSNRRPTSQSRPATAEHDRDVFVLD